jgi:hypothetical protein
MRDYMPEHELPDAYGIDDESFPESFGARMIYRSSVEFDRLSGALPRALFALRSPICSQLERARRLSLRALDICIYSVVESAMWAVFGRRRRLVSVLASTLFAAAIGATPTRADTVTVNVDQARVMKLPERVATIIIGNPLIADATLQSGGVLVLTGKGYGATNLLALDRAGRIIMNKTVQVLRPAGRDLVVVYKGVERESYSCAPECERRITLGDSAPYFNATLAQTGARNGRAQTSKNSP